MPLAARLPVLVALFSALVLRALVPAGWMPAEGQGILAIELCPSAAAMPMEPLDRQHGAMPMGHGGHKDQHGDCAFSPLHAGFAPAEVASTILAPIDAFAAPAKIFAAVILTTGPPSLPPPSTGPPALA